MNCAWCGKEFYQGMQWDTIMQHLVDCINDMFRKQKEKEDA